MTRLYEGSRRNRIITPGRGIIGGGDGAAGVMTQPYVINFESETIGAQEAALEATTRHHDLYNGANAYVRAIDYGALTAIRDNRLAKCWAGIGTDAVGFALSVVAGKGFTPSGGNVVVLEGIFNAMATGPAVELYATDESFQEGIKFTFNGSNFYVWTYASGSPTQKLGPVATGLVSPPTNAAWFSFTAQYNQSNDECYARIVELGLIAGDQEDSNWVNVGTVASPTFNSATEWTRFQGYISGTSSGDCGVAQLRVGDDGDGYGLGAAQTHNYIDEVT